MARASPIYIPHKLPLTLSRDAAVSQKQLRVDLLEMLSGNEYTPSENFTGDGPSILVDVPL